MILFTLTHHLRVVLITQRSIYPSKSEVAEAIAQAEQELDVDELKAFEEKMYGDVWDKEKYLNWMYENLMAIKSIMSETASIYVHLDWHIGHYVKSYWMKYLENHIF